MDAATQALIRERAGQRCEYCLLPQQYSALRFHVEHIAARQHGGSDEPANLALACPECNLRKGTNLSGLDPDTGTMHRLFNPRTDKWGEHFELRGSEMVGRTPVGRTTIRLLRMNTDTRVHLREILRSLTGGEQA